MSSNLSARTRRRVGTCARRRFAVAGFTLAELLTVVAIVAVLAMLFGPMLGGTVHAARAADARAALLATVRAAIGRASTHGAHVVACPAGGTRCADSVDWSGGWLLFEDRDGDRDRGAAERVLAAWPALGAGVHLRSTAGRKRLVFQPNGGNAGSNVTLTLCDGRGPTAAIQLILANDGRLREARPPTDAALACVAPL